MMNILVARRTDKRNFGWMAMVTCLIASLSSQFAVAWPDGITGRTLRDGGAGCAACHSVTVLQTLGVSINGLASLGIGQTSVYSVNVSSGPNNTAIGFDAAASFDGLTATGTNTQKLGTEITHTLTKNFTGGTGAGSYTFSFTVPGAATAGTTYTLYATARSGGEWGHATSITVTAARINQATLTALIGGSGTPAASSVGLTGSLSTSGGSGTGTVTYASLTNSVCNVSATTVSYIAVGTCTVQATKALDSQYNATTDIVSISVGQGVQTITISPIAPKLTTNPPFTVSATGGASGNPVTFVASGVCSSGGTNGSTITLTGVVGTCTVTGNQLGNANYLAAPPAVLNFSVVAAGEPFPPNCQLPLGWITPAGAATTWSVATDFATAGVCSLKSTPLANSGTNLSSRIEFAGTFVAGNVTFKRKVSSEPNYDCFRFLVDGAEQAVGGNCPNLGSYVPGIAIGASGELDWATITVPLAAGAHTLTWSYDKDTSCCVGGLDAAWIDEVTLPLGPPVVTSASTATGAVGAAFSYTIVASNSPWNYTASGLPPGLTVDSSGLISGTPTLVGSYTMMVTAVNGASSVTQAVAVNIAKGTQVINFAPLVNKAFDAPDFVVSATGGATGNPVTFAVSGDCSNSGANGQDIQIVGTLGTCNIVASQAGDANYFAASPVTQSFLVFDPAQEYFPRNCVMPAGWSVPSGLGWNVAFDSAASGGCSLRANLDLSGNPAIVQYTGSFATGNISFSRRVAAGSINFFGLIESCFRFYIDDVAQNIGGGTCDGAPGQGGFIPFGTISVPITAGVHTISWQAIPRSFIFPLGADAWIDNVVLPQTSLTVIKAGGGVGAVSSAPGGINSCGGTCSALFSAGSVVSLNPAPALGSYLSSWSGGGCTGSGACNVTMSTSQSVTATFSLVTAPGVPTGVTATPGNASASVSFSAPSFNGGSPITGYRATCGSTFATGAASPIVVTGLTNGAAVNCTVSVSNAFASSLESSPPVSVTPRTVPDIPTGVSAAPGNTQATISFTPSLSNGGSAITGYTARCAASGQTTRTSTGAGSPLTVLSMVNGIAYSCSVVATNVAGSSAASATASVTPRTAPAAPTLLIATPRDGRIIFDFVPSASDGGAAITGYTVSCNAGTVSGSGITSPIVIGGLANGTTYNCSVAAINAAGPSGASNTVSAAPGVETGSALWSQVCTACHAPTPSGNQVNAAGTTATVLSYVIANQPTMALVPDLAALTVAERTQIANYINSQLPTAPTVTAFNTPASIDVSALITLGTVSYESIEVLSGPARGALSAFAGTNITYTPNAGIAGNDSFSFRGVRTVPTLLRGDARTVNITVSPPPVPVITSAATASGTNGVAFSYQITASNGPTGFGASGLPTNLTVNPMTGLISGIPNVGGTYMATITASNANPASPGTAPLTITLNAAGQVITFPAQTPATRAFSPSPSNTFSINPVATASSLLAVTYSSKTPGVCSVAGTTVTMLTAGTCTIGTNQGGDVNFSAAPEATQSVTITPIIPGAPTIGAATPGNNQGTIAFSPPTNTGGTTISGYTATCTPNGTGTATVSPIVVSGLSNGTTYTCAVTATNSAGTGPASATVTVTPAPTPTPPVITSATSANFTVNAPGSFSLTATGTPAVFTYSVIGTLPAGVTLNPSTGVLSGTPTQAGPFAVTLGVANGVVPNAAQLFTLNVARAAQTITFNNPGTQVFSASLVPLSAVATSSLAVSFVSDTTGVCTVTGSNVSLVSVGTCTIRAQQAGNTNFNPAADVPQSFSVVQGGQTITFGAQVSPRAFVASTTFALAPVAAASSGLAVVYTSLTSGVCTIATTTVTMVRAGICTIAANQAGSANFSAAAQVTQSITFTGSAPGAPTLGTATGGDTKITVTFTPPASDGGASISSYTATCGVATASGAGSPLVVTGLMNGTSYLCSVTATNAINTGPASGSLMATPSPLPGATVWASSCGLGGCHGSPPNPPPGTPIGTRLNVGGSSPAVLNYVVANPSPLTSGLMNALVGPLSQQQRTDVAAYIADFIPPVSATTPLNTPVDINVGSQVFLNSAIAAFTGLQQVAPPANGALSAFTATPVPTITYTPNPGFVGTDTFTYRATQAQLNSDIRTVSVTVQPAAPVITSALTATGTVGQAFNYQIAATNAPTGYDAPGLPANLTVNLSTGVISGIPAAGGSTMVTISASNAGGPGSATLTINIGLVPQTIVFGAQPTPRAFSQGGTFAIAPTATGGASGNPIVYSSTTPGVCSVSTTTVTMLAAGICTIAANQAGNATFAAAAQVTQSVSITGVAPAAPTIGAGTAGNTQATINFTAPSNTGGLPITAYTVNCNGITVGGANSPIVVSGLVNGTPYTCTVQATNLAGTSVPSASVIVTPVAIAFTGNIYSRKTHAGTDRDLPLNAVAPIGGAITVEPRAIGAGHRIVFVFNNPISSVTSVSVVNAAMNPVGVASPSFNGNELIVTLTGIPDNQRVTVTATGVNGALTQAVSVGFLVGDFTNSKSVNAADISALKTHADGPVNATTFIYDLNANGTITSTDISAVKTRSGLVMP